MNAHYHEDQPPLKKQRCGENGAWGYGYGPVVSGQPYEVQKESIDTNGFMQLQMQLAEYMKWKNTWNDDTK